MARPVILFTGQWADMPLSQLAPLAKEMGYDGLELCTWGDHFEVHRALEDDHYVRDRLELLQRHDLACYAVAAHMVGQAVCDPVDERHKEVLPARVWGDGDPEGVRRRAAQELIDTARAARKLGVDVVTGFSGSAIWHSVYAFPPTTQAYWQRGFDDFAQRFEPILAAFEAENVTFALEVHPTEIAFDIATAERALQAVGNHRRLAFNYDPSHLAYQGVDYALFLRRFPERIAHVHVKDVWWGRGDGTVGVFGGHTTFGDARRAWDFRSPGRGDVDFEEIIVALNDIAYNGPLAVEWEDARMDRIHGATEAAAFVRALDFEPSVEAFDAAFRHQAGDVRAEGQEE